MPNMQEVVQGLEQSLDGKGKKACHKAMLQQSKGKGW